MSDEEFNAAIAAITEGVPVMIVVSRLARTVRALVESGGAPAVDLLRTLVRMRADIDATALVETADGDEGAEEPL